MRSLQGKYLKGQRTKSGFDKHNIITKLGEQRECTLFLDKFEMIGRQEGVRNKQQISFHSIFHENAL